MAALGCDVNPAVVLEKADDLAYLQTAIPSSSTTGDTWRFEYHGTAKKYTNRGLQFLGRIQDGNIGLMKTVCDRSSIIEVRAVDASAGSAASRIGMQAADLLTQRLAAALALRLGDRDVKCAARPSRSLRRSFRAWLFGGGKKVAAQYSKCSRVV